ncbi:glycosyltransferase [Thalassospira profundimaris]|uniref:Spore protein YkvP/CgeB glycosyl transferase-like domain-containing protein n=1 Tax=Thalassospira profundimaris TaxID=502049 RepID=A0A367WKX5_9PROT|nr:glycosyltransferase [Thalassospira profundimaris]RCK42088.1 hypothetical protein TH30_21255 [Thalassospira profundimaris]
MANIVVTHFSGLLVNGKYRTSVFYEGFINSLLENGNNVLHVITSNYLLRPWNGSNTTISPEIGQLVLEEIINFNPDLVISFNNSSIEGIEDAVDCPIALWEADTFQFFNDKDYVKRNADRYHFLAFASDAIEVYKRELGISDNRVRRVPAATGVKSTKEEKRYNISFIGNTFSASPTVFKYLAQHPSVRDLDTSVFSDAQVSQYCETLKTLSGLDGHAILFRKSGQDRLSICHRLFEHGLHLFGPDDWYRLGMLGDDILDAYDPRVVYSLHHNQLIYNRSKVSLNINHAQASTGFAWRVIDILASDSALLTTPSSDLKALCGDKVSLQVFNSVAEADDLAGKLLKDNSLREDVIAQQNELVEMNFRWKHRFPIISEFTGVELNAGPEKGTYKEVLVEPTANVVSQAVQEIYRGITAVHKAGRIVNTKRGLQARGEVSIGARHRFLIFILQVYAALRAFLRRIRVVSRTVNFCKSAVHFIWPNLVVLVRNARMKSTENSAKEYE